MSSGSLTNSLLETLAVVAATGEPLTTPEIANRLDLGRRSTYERLERLVDHDRLETKKVGASARVWWRPPPAPTATDPGRQRHRNKTHAEFESLVDAVEEYAIFTLDTEGHVQTWNRGAKQINGYEAADILGEHLSRFYTETDKTAGVPDRNLREATAHGSTEDEGWRVRSDGSRFWATVTLTALRNDDEVVGYIKITRDMTERRATEQALRHEHNLLEEIQETSPVGISVFDAEGELLQANQRFMQLLGRGEGDAAPTECLLGEQPVRDAAGEVIARSKQPALKALSTGTPVMDQQIRLNGPDGRTRWLSANAKPFESDFGGVVVTLADVTALKQQAQRLEGQRDDLESELETIFERVDDGFFALDDERRFTYVNHRASEQLQRPAAELVGEYIWDVLERGPKAVAAFEQASQTQQSVTFEEFYEPFGAWFEIRVYPSQNGLSVHVADITERKQLERELRTEKEHFRVALENSPVVAFRLDTDLRYTWVYNPHDEFSMDDVLGKRDDELLPAEAAETVLEPKRRALETGESVRQEVSYELPTGTVSYDLSVDPFRNESGEVVGLTAASVDLTEPKQRQQELEHQREQLAALNSLNEVVSEITDAVISQPTREEIEQTVCDHLAAADSYLFAWVGETNTTSSIVSLRAEAGVEGYLDDISISVDPKDERSEGPTGRAFRTGTIQTTQDLETDKRYKPWRGQIESYGWRSSAAIPIVYEGTIYGVLNVYADRPRAFEHKERDVIAQLGEVVGHAIAATERKQALMSDEITELVFSVPTMLASVGIESDTDGEISFDYAVPTGNREFLQYGTVDIAALPTLEALVECLPHFEEVRIFDGAVETARFELRLSAPPVVSAVASHGGYVQQSTIEDGEFRMTIHLPTTVSARRVIDAVHESYTTARLLRRRQITRSDKTLTRIQRVMTHELTDRQRAVLETAVYSGFFNWPRDASGTEIAATLGVSAPTFHQHLRIAQRKLFESVFSVPAST